MTVIAAEKHAPDLGPAAEATAAPPPDILAAGHDSPAPPQAGGHALARFIGIWALRLGALAFGVLVWHLAVAVKFNWIISFQNVPSPRAVWNALMHHLAGDTFYMHILVSMRRIVIAYGFAVVLGVATGVLIGRSRIAREIVMPYVEIIRPIPAVTWIPLAILMWPTEESSVIYITYLGALFPIILNTLHGVEQTPEVLVRAARSLGAKRSHIFFHVILPAALPSIAAGFAIGMGVAWFSLMAGEIISGQYGIGYFTWNAYSLVNYPDIVLGMLSIGLLGTASTYLVRAATQPMLAWQRKTR
jgi:NitT/TauT family transport system permease protein